MPTEQQDSPQLILAHKLAFEDLYRHEGLLRIEAIFLDHCKAGNAQLYQRLLAARENSTALAAVEISALLLELAPLVEAFLLELFNVQTAQGEYVRKQQDLKALYACKRQFVQRAAKLAVVSKEQGEAACADMEALCGSPLTELAYAERVLDWLKQPADNAAALASAARYAVWAVHTPEGSRHHAHGVLFRLAHKIDHQHLVPLESRVIGDAPILCLPPENLHPRQGFKLTDAGSDLAGALDQANYCIWCHGQGRDSCSTGMHEKSGGAFKKSPLGVVLAGCPLEEKISEMNLLMAGGNSIAALAMAVVDNPMLAATGHRICNDCMKSCIYQKQEPVNIPQIETRMLKDVLELPWGFEIYSLLTRWNPLNLKRPLPVADSGYKVLVAGLGPAGFTLAHHLMNDGHHVVGIDGLKIEPLPSSLSGIDAAGKHVPFEPVHTIQLLYEELDERSAAGFGGVAEYGITVRWDKNFLKVIRLLLERRSRFTMFGGVLMGGTLTINEAFSMGFDHIALCLGAGRPTFLSIPNGMARGVRKASDFLMALQLTGAARETSVANLQIRLPVVVIGGGLTAVDTATEALAYYPVQVEKFLCRYETLASEQGEEVFGHTLSPEEALITDEFIAHARAIRAEYEAARKENREADILSLLNGWGGSTIAYRRRLIDAPSYILNHEELRLAMQEGIRFAEMLSPMAVDIDRFGHSAGLHMSMREIHAEGHIVDTGEVICLPARSILIAVGTNPNTQLAEDDPENVRLDGHFFRAVDAAGHPVSPEHIAKPSEAQVLMSIRPDGKAMSFFGDLHPSYAGNVVKAMASARQGYPVVSAVLAKNRPSHPLPSALCTQLNAVMRPCVHTVTRLTASIVEVVVYAPKAAAAFRPGQFFRLQNFEAHAAEVDGTTLAMEGLALTGASVDVERGLISLIVLEMGGSSDLCALLKPGEPVVLMGPTGSPTEIRAAETVLLVGGGLGNAVLFSIGQAFRQAGSKVLYFAGYKKIEDRYRVEDIEAAADVVIWCCDEAPGFTPSRQQDMSFVGNIVEAIQAYGNGRLAQMDIPLSGIDRLIAIGSAGMMAAVASARYGVLREFLAPAHVAIGSINSPMQCMMKGICAQCLQLHRDPETGTEMLVFSCINQDQPLDIVDFTLLQERLRQQSVAEKVTVGWIDRCLKHLGVRPN